MQCHICNSTEFISHDGVYFCSECNSQKEASRKEESQQDGGFSRKSLLRSSPKDKKKVSKKVNKLAPWTVADGYNTILHKQVSDLIRLGASENLKNVVLHIWSKYLCKCEIAFRTDNKAASDKRVPRLSAFLRQRDVKVLYGDRVFTKKIRKKKRLKEKELKNKSETENEETDISEECETTDYESNTCESEGESNISSDDSSKSRRNAPYKLSTHARKFQKSFGKLKIKNSNDRRKRLLVHNMTLSKTLCFCYLGLLYTEDQLLLCDLLRIVRDGKIPYINASHCFPPSMELQAEDYFYFNSSVVPTVEEISILSGKLFKFLKLPSFKHPSVMPIVFRFVKDLNLPDSILPIINILHNKMKGSYSMWYETNRKVPHYDIQAMALIVVSLKLIFVLDDKFELEHSSVMTKINVFLKGPKLFVWNDWRRQMQLKEYLFIKDGCTYSDYSNLECLSAEEILRKKELTKIKNSEDSTYFKHANKNTQLIGRREIKTLFKNIISKQTDEAASHNISYFPLKCELTHFITEGDSWKMFSETQKRDLTLLNKSFSTDMIFYKNMEEVGDESKELIYLLLSTLYESIELLTLCNNSSNYQNIIKTSSNYWYKRISHKKFHGLQEVKQIWCEKLPTSFVWLVKLLSKYMQISCEELYTEIQTVEKKLSLLNTDCTNV